jgi:hypothetical protein
MKDWFLSLIRALSPSLLAVNPKQKTKTISEVKA